MRWVAITVLLLCTPLVLADGWDTTQASHPTTFTDVLTSKTDGVPVTVVDNEGLQVSSGNLEVRSDGGQLYLRDGVNGDVLPIIHFQNVTSGMDWILKHDENVFHIQTETTPGSEVISLHSAGGGRLGVGTSFPSRNFVVNGSSANTHASIRSSDTGIAWLLLGDQASDSAGRVGYDNNVNALSLWTGNNERLTVDVAGNVGIATTSPQGLTHVVGANTNELIVEASGGNPDISFAEAGDIKAQIRYGITGNGLLFAVDDANTGYGAIGGMVLFLDGDGSGNVGIGTTTPGTAKLYVSNPGTAVGLYIGDGVPFGQAKIEIDGPPSTHLWVAENGARVFSVMPGGNGYFEGNLGIGVANPTSKLHVVGKATITGGVDPPYVSFSDESHESIRAFAEDITPHEKVMQFWNGDAHRFEVYVIDEDAFYTMTGEPVQE